LVRKKIFFSLGDANELTGLVVLADIWKIWGRLEVHKTFYFIE
jgi:hypothetical protein